MKCHFYCLIKLIIKINECLDNKTEIFYISSLMHLVKELTNPFLYQPFTKRHNSPCHIHEAIAYLSGSLKLETLLMNLIYKQHIVQSDYINLH